MQTHGAPQGWDPTPTHRLAETRCHVTEPREDTGFYRNTKLGPTRSTDTRRGHVLGTHTWTEAVHTQQGQPAPAGVLETPMLHTQNPQHKACRHTHTHTQGF